MIGIFEKNSYAKSGKFLLNQESWHEGLLNGAFNVKLHSFVLQFLKKYPCVIIMISNKTCIIICPDLEM